MKRNTMMQVQRITYNISIFLLIQFIAYVYSEVNIIPNPVSLVIGNGIFNLGSGTDIYVHGNTNDETGELEKIGQYLEKILEIPTGESISVIKSSSYGPDDIFLTTVGGSSTLGNEGYELDINGNGCIVKAYKAEGVFRGVTTIRQLLPFQIESHSQQNGVQWKMDYVDITDYPRYEYRSYMLDPARNWVTVDQVKAEIDRMSLYKFNVLHLHLTDDQGWRIFIDGWPKLTSVASDNDCGDDGPGAGPRFYTQAQFTEIVDYASERYIEVVPEVDFPGHTNSMLCSYPNELLGVSSHPKFSGIGVHTSDFDVYDPDSWDLIADAIGQIHKLTNCSFFHIGGDEASGITHSEYVHAMDKAKQIADSIGDITLIGWDEMATSNLSGSTIYAQYWSSANNAKAAADKGMPLIISPASKIYLDIIYSDNPPIPADCGLKWAGENSVEDAYDWDPGSIVAGIGDDKIAGIEAALWGETIESQAHLDILSYPRMLGGAEVGWTPQSKRSWNEYKVRLGKHGPRMTRLGIKFYESPDIPWVYDPTLVNQNISGLVSTSGNIYVNMVQNIMQFSIFDSKPRKISVYNVKGCLIKKLTVTGQEVVWNVKTIPDGLYIVRISGFNSFDSFKVMISK
jgi:hexosaminidase